MSRQMSRYKTRMYGTVTHADGTVQALRRRGASGRTVPISQPVRTWHEIVATGRRATSDVTGGASAQPDHPSRKHDSPARAVPVAVQAVAPVLGQPRRRFRRELARQAA